MNFVVMIEVRFTMRRAYTISNLLYIILNLSSLYFILLNISEL